MSALATYVALVALSWAVEYLMLYWPYLFLLSLQEVLGDADNNVEITLVFGGLLVAAVGWLVERSSASGLGVGAKMRRGAWVTVLTTGCLTVLAWLTAELLGLRTGV